jgi:hypothetical protein
MNRPVLIALPALTPLIIALTLPALGAPPKPSAKPKPAAKAAPKKAENAPIRIDLSKEKEGAEPVRFLAMVGDWSIAKEEGKPVLLVDGRTWKNGQPAGGLADKARAIYGSRHEEFIDNVKAFAYFPYAVARDVPDFHDGAIEIRFRLLGGALDQCAGILFNLKPNGDYLAVRVNAKEDNLVLWKFENGKRSFVQKGVHDAPIPFQQWHTMKIAVHGTQLEAWYNGEKLLDRTLEAPVSGKVGVWSKTDSVSEFADYVVTPEAAPAAASAPTPTKSSGAR